MVFLTVRRSGWGVQTTNHADCGWGRWHNDWRGAHPGPANDVPWKTAYHCGICYCQTGPQVHSIDFIHSYILMSVVNLFPICHLRPLSSSQRWDLLSDLQAASGKRESQQLLPWLDPSLYLSGHFPSIWALYQGRQSSCIHWFRLK